jgi:hypothetical protein
VPRFKQVDAFTARPFFGNPVAVVLGADVSDLDGGRAEPSSDDSSNCYASNTITWRAASPLRSLSNASFTPSRPIRAEIISSSRSRPSR